MIDRYRQPNESLSLMNVALYTMLNVANALDLS